MGNHPKLFITDQDPALRKVVPSVLPNTHHRFCLWHITKKVPDKISAALRADPDFKSEFDGLIWSEDDEPEEFEEKWQTLIAKYDLGGDKWFTDMYDLRSLWIPAFFRDVGMSGLFRTTSLSESENSFFKRYVNRNDDLVRFLMHYQSALDAQRAAFKTLTAADETGVPTMAAALHMEQHAASMYTNAKFYEVQDEIVGAVMKCVMSSMVTEGDMKVYNVDDGYSDVVEVTFDSEFDLIECECKLFIRRGIPCRHMIFVMRTRRCTEIPDKYILKRWSKISKSALSIGDNYFEPDTNSFVSGNQKFFTELCNSIVSVRNNMELQNVLLSDLKALSVKFSELGLSPDAASSKRNDMELFYGCKVPEQIVVGTPDVSVTKGSGIGGRRKPAREIAIDASKKRFRTCRTCNRVVDHDSRNCPLKE